MVRRRKQTHLFFFPTSLIAKRIHIMKVSTSLYLGVAFLMSSFSLVASKKEERPNIIMMTTADTVPKSRKRYAPSSPANAYWYKKMSWNINKQQYPVNKQQVMGGYGMKGKPWAKQQTMGTNYWSSNQPMKWSSKNAMAMNYWSSNQPMKWSSKNVMAMNYDLPTSTGKVPAYKKKRFYGKKTNQGMGGNNMKAPTPNMQWSYWKYNQAMAMKYRPQYRPRNGAPHVPSSPVALPSPSPTASPRLVEPQNGDIMEIPDGPVLVFSTLVPSAHPSPPPSHTKSGAPTLQPSRKPSDSTWSPSLQPSKKPSGSPMTLPPSSKPFDPPTRAPSATPTQIPNALTTTSEERRVGKE